MVDVIMASLPERDLNITLESVLKQPVVNNIYCLLNNYPSKEHLITDSKLSYIDRENEKGGTEKLYGLKLATSEYVAILDDDLIIQDGYFEGLMRLAEKGYLASYHGRIFNKLPLTSYFRDNIARFHCLKYVPFDVQVDTIGSGVSMIKNGLLDRDTYDYVKYSDMCDIQLSFFAKIKGIERWVAKHEEGFIKNIPYKYTVFKKYRKNHKHYTQFINDVWNINLANSTNQ